MYVEIGVEPLKGGRMLSKTQLQYQKHLSLRTIRKEWELHHHQAAFVSPAAHRRGIANDHEPLDRALRPEFLLKRLIGMSIESGPAAPRAPYDAGNCNPSSIYRGLLTSLPMSALFQNSSLPYVSERQTPLLCNFDRVFLF